MAFTDWRFLVVFLPGVLGLHFLIARLTSRDDGDGLLRFHAANWVLVAGALGFLAAGTGRFAGVLGTAALLLHVLGRGIAGAHRHPPGTRPDRISAVPEICFSLAVTGSLFLFVFFRRLNPFAGDILPWFDPFAITSFPVPGLLAPLGLAVFTCHAVSYAADVRRGEAAAPRNPVHTLTYLFLFPFLVAGPLLRFRDVSAQLATRQAGMAAFAYGVRRFTIGLAKVWLIAGTLAPPAELAFSMSADTLDAAHAWLGLACFSLQIYFALSGYADMAIGLGRMLGFRLPEHFQWPYAADSLHGFWRRWSMTLTAWFDAYLRLPLRPPPGESAGREAQAALSVLLLFLLIAVWHGGGRPLLLWGAWHGAAVALERTRWGALLARLPAPLRHGYVLLVVTAGWILFRADSLPDAAVFVRALAGFGAAPSLNDPLPLTGGVQLALAAGTVAAAPMLPAVSRWTVTVDAIATALQMIVTAAALFVWTRVLGRGRRADVLYRPMPATDAVIRPFDSRADYDACVRLQREVWGEHFVDVAPATILMVSQRVGGVSAGAFDADGRLLGFVFGISGIRDGELAHWSDMLAVRPEARGAGLGKRLKHFQREQLLERGIRRMLWTYDPLVSRNANLNLNGLGALPVEYVVNMYGDTRSALHAGLDTDRFVVEWRLDEARPAGTEPAAAAAETAPVIDPAWFDRERPLPTDPCVRVAAPADIDGLKAADPARARAWQQAQRRAFAWYLANGYRVSGFEHRRAPDDSHYLVTRAPDPATGAPASAGESSRSTATDDR